MKKSIKKPKQAGWRQINSGVGNPGRQIVAVSEPSWARILLVIGLIALLSFGIFLFYDGTFGVGKHPGKAIFGAVLLFVGVLFVWLIVKPKKSAVVPISSQN